MLKQRVITGIILAVCFISALFALPSIGFTLVMGGVVAYASWEWSRLAGLKAIVPRFLYVLAVVCLGAVLAVYLGFDSASLLTENFRFLLVLACTWWALALLWVQGYPSSAILWGRCWASLLMGFLVLLPMWLALGGIMALRSGSLLLLSVILLVALADIGAYFVGRTMGCTKLAVEVSPGKTWEGLLGGQLSIIIAVTIAALIMDVGAVKLGYWLLVALATGLASVLGDLLESMVKRQAGVKDSGTILPGHGGILDRIDGWTAALPVYALFLSLLYSRL